MIYLMAILRTRITLIYRRVSAVAENLFKSRIVLQKTIHGSPTKGLGGGLLPQDRQPRLPQQGI